MNKSSKRLWLIGVATVSLGLATFAFSGIFFWSPLNCWHEEVDIYSGRIRHVRYLAFLRVGERVEETLISEAVKESRVSPQAPDWRRVATFSPGTDFSPYYPFYGARAQEQSLVKLWNTAAFSPSARRVTAERFLAEWQEGGSPGGEGYIKRLDGYVSRLRRREPLIPIEGEQVKGSYFGPTDDDPKDMRARAI